MVALKSFCMEAQSNKRIAKNTLFLYFRMFFGMLVSLYTSRVVLNALGVEDYGIYNVVGGFVVMFSMVSSSLSSSVSRFLTFELGKGNQDGLKNVFSTSLFIHVVLAGIVCLLAETLGLWFLNTQMTIPENRLYAANWVFQASLITFVFGLFSVPYHASIVAHERMTAFAYIGILDVILRLGIVLFVAFSPFSFDRLIVYALLLVVVSVFIQMVYLNYCRSHFEECRLRMHFDRNLWRSMGVFAGWNFIGSTASLLKDQGVNLLLNLFFGPVVNAARGISTSVNAVLSSFSGNFMTAINPQITKSYAVANYDYMFSLVERGSRFSYYILLFLALPVLLETDFILTIWLKSYPDHTINFVRLILMVTLCDVLSNTLITLQLATGKLRNYQLAVGGTLLLNFPLSYICLKLNFPPEAPLIVALVISMSCLLLRLFFLKRMVGISIKGYLKNVGLNVFTVTILAAFPPFIVHLMMPESGVIRLLVVCLLSTLCAAASIYFVGCSTVERKFIRDRFNNLKLRMLHDTNQR